MTGNNIGSLIVALDSSPNGKDLPVMTVGKKKRGQHIEVVNVIIGPEALELWHRLAVVKRVPEK